MLSRLKNIFDWRYVVAFPLAAGVIHLIATFMAMNDTAQSAYSRLSSALPRNTMSVLEVVSPKMQPLPFMSSDHRYAICPFDTSSGALDVRAMLPDQGWTVGVYRPDGTSAYFAAAEPGRRTSISLLIIPAEDQFMGLTPQAVGKAPGTEPQLTVAVRVGMVVVRAPDNGAPYRAETEAMLAKATCRRSAV